MAKKATVVQQDPQTAIATKIAPISGRAKSVTISNDAEYASAGEFLKVIKGLRAEVDSVFDPIIKAADAAHKEAIAQKRKVEAPLADAEAALKCKVAGYIRAQQEERRLEQERLRKIAEEVARQDTLRLQREAQQRAEEEQLLRAQKLAELGKADEAAEVLVADVVVRPVMPVQVNKSAIEVKPVAKVEGISVRRSYSAEVTDLHLLVVAVANGLVPLQAVKADIVFLNQQARAYKEMLSYPGVKLVVGDNVAAGR